MGKVENSTRKTGSNQFLVGCQCEKEGNKVSFRYIQQHNNRSSCQHSRTSRCDRRRYAGCRALEVLTDACALCESRTR